MNKEDKRGRVRVAHGVRTSAIRESSHLSYDVMVHALRYSCTALRTLRWYHPAYLFV